MAHFQSSEFQRFGDYILLDRINVGGMAEVFRGKQIGVEGFARLVALKRILPNISADQDFIDMFIDEAKLAVQMRHANIVQIYDLGHTDGSYYIAMEYIAGVDLRTVWDRARRRNRLLPIAMSAYIMQKVAEGLDFAHRKKDDRGNDIGLVHRDISPQNVLISFEGEVKVVDFGIAKAKNKVSKTQAGTLKGKFGYMSPEQVRGIELDNRSDIFAVGACLYELIVGERLFLGESDFSTLEKVRNVEMVPPSQLNKGLSPQIERVVMKALQKNRDDRYRYTSEVSEDLQRYLFESNQPFQRTDLARYMKQHFKPEIDKEYERLERYRDVSLANVAPPPPQQPEQQDFEITVDEPDAEAAMPAAGMPQAAMPAAGMPQAAMSATGMPQAAMPVAGMPQAAMPVAGMPQAAMPAAGAPLAPPSPATLPPPPSNTLPGWAKGLIATLSVMVLLAVGAVVWAVVLREPLKPAVVQSGSLTIDVEPADAEIWINSKQVATQSPFATDLPVQTHVLEIRKQGYKRILRPIKIEAGQQRVESIKLEPNIVQASILIRSKPPGIDIFVDGKQTGLQTPATVTKLGIGSRNIVLKRDGNEVYQTQVELKTGKVEAIDVDLTTLPVRLKVTAGRSGAKVFVGGKEVGVAPLELTEQKPGETVVKIIADKCDPYLEKVTLIAGAKHSVSAPLVCEGGAPDDVAKNIGRVSITATLIADVFFGAEKIGRTPLLGFATKPGEHNVKLVPLSGDKAPFSRKIRVKAGKTVSFSHSF
ncbi:MAG: PEGA domain-containing protein [Myxococcota bacterium]|nr:PEGA domain-containing protein [Myxococcota bacterium]